MLFRSFPGAILNLVTRLRDGHVASGASGGGPSHLVIDQDTVALHALASVAIAVDAVLVRDIISSDDYELLMTSWPDAFCDEPAPVAPSP